MNPILRTVPILLPQGFFSLAYAQWGPERGAPVICAHGLTRNGRDFDSLALALARDGRRVVAVDFPGRGRSDWLSDASLYAYPTYVHALATLIARLDVERVDWVGTSMGGLVGMFLAAQPRSPIARLVLNDVGPFIPSAALERIAGYVGVETRFATLPDVEAYLRRVAAPFGPLSDAQWRHLAIHGAVSEGSGWRLHYDPAIGTALRAGPLRDVDLWGIWTQVRCAVLSIRGAESDVLAPETVQRMAGSGHAPVSCIAFHGCGHAPALMADDQIAAVLDFLK
jgi:pimeloyl-ACP methyl ester carboxylesterase